MPSRTLDGLTLPENPLVAVLEGVEKPGNVGAVLRSADGAGVSAVIVADGGTDLYNPNAIRASLGTIFTVPVCEALRRETLAWLRKQGLRIYAARLDGSIPTPRPTIAARLLWCWAARRPGFPCSGRPPT